MVRYLLSFLVGAVVSVGLFVLMQGLIHLGVQTKKRPVSHRVIDFVRLRHESEVQQKKRQLPQKQSVKNQPAPPSMKLPSSAPSGSAGPAVNLAPPPPAVTSDVKLAGGPSLGGVVSDADIVPLVRIQPMYPRAAAMKQIEGWVEIEFDISTKGTVINARVVDAHPPNIFNKAALDAIRKWKYKPRIRNGVPVVTKGVRVRLKFELEKN
ncbi:MAG: energy transducer TonB [Deltaproteobacteria bacterium]|nr:MAG: energy transducer TonB [Deltaproteobacteria bacterium]